MYLASCKLTVLICRSETASVTVSHQNCTLPHPQGQGGGARCTLRLKSGVADPLPKERGRRGLAIDRPIPVLFHWNAAVGTRLLKRKARMAMAALIEQDVNKPHSISGTLSTVPQVSI